MHRLLSILLLFTACFYAGCSSPPRAGVNLDLASQPTFYVDDWVRRGNPQILVHPVGTPATKPTALFVPLRVTQPMNEPSIVGNNISRMVWQNWLQNQVFPVIEFDGGATPFRPDIALRLARQKGAQVVIGGYVTYFVDGGTVGDTRVSLQLDIYDVATGQLVWSMVHAGLLERQFTNDYLLFAVKARMPSDPAWAVTNTIAADMGTQVKNWLTPPEAALPDHPAAF